jgi:hypothetical protein
MVGFPLTDAFDAGTESNNETLNMVSLIITTPCEFPPAFHHIIQRGAVNLARIIEEMMWETTSGIPQTQAAQR